MRAWIETGPDDHAIDCVLDALQLIAEDPSIGHRDVRHRAQVFRFTVPEVRLALSYLVAPEFKTVKIIEIVGY